MADAEKGHAAGEHANRNAPAHAPVAHAPEADVPAEHGEVVLGPVDWPAWIAGLVGVLAGLAVIVALFLSTQS